jgi:hypothetical protein
LNPFASNIKMGVYDIYMGKGIILPVSVFVRRFLKEIQELTADKATDGCEQEIIEEEIIEEIVKKYIGDYEVCTIGHDAFNGRYGSIAEMFDGTDAFDNIITSESDVDNSDLPFTSIHCSTAIFIGYYKSIAPNDLGYYIKAPEVIYSIAAFIPLILKHYPVLLAKECTSLNIFNQEAHIWTFALDCCCCG